MAVSESPKFAKLKVEDVAELVFGEEALMRAMGEDFASVQLSVLGKGVEITMQRNFGKVYLVTMRLATLLERRCVKSKDVGLVLSNIVYRRRKVESSCNIISARQLLESGVVTSFIVDAWKMSRGSLFFLR